VKKKEVLENLLIKQSLDCKQDYIKQYSILNNLLKKYSNPLFWDQFCLKEKIKSLYFFKTEAGRKIIQQKYKEFCQSPASKYKKYKISTRKSGGKVPHKKIKKQTIRRFLNG
tara:strand:+ start:4389 stop:4724 length:336 start_codon:yes stop_codon:yes gene_type:complete